MNRGDTLYIELDYTVNGEPLTSIEWSEIEFYFGNNRYLLSEGDIILDSELDKYCVQITQVDSLDLNRKIEYQIRLRKGTEVVSSLIRQIVIGKSISRKVI